MFGLSEFELAALGLSLKIALIATLLTLPLALILAWLFARCQFKGRNLLLGIVHLPLVMPPVVIGLFLLTAFGKQGYIGSWLYDLFGISFAFNWKGAALAAAVMALPLMVRSIQLAIENVPTKLEKAARSLGSSSLKTFFTITIPLSISGIAGATILGFARSLGEFGATITFVSNIPGKTQTLPLALYTMTQVPDGEASAYRLAIISAVLALLAIIASEIMARKARQQLGKS
ncbi:molybdate ABC transporter permease subunit [Curvivirga aplysinae]|uniref:molybdate ABC transporter permease subunit n=1 Tax=Curvivirga aplysinae TaxID=2529852 RepID=UPI0012BD045E|nr:molybdate ABC transporter permease subunit [Curvivirga aplysinae]MTI09808.1 molybdate ABC transporter permease subunit [Curvivirga aplysinae]